MPLKGLINLKKILLIILCVCLAIPQCFAADIAPLTEEIELHRWSVEEYDNLWSFSGGDFSVSGSSIVIEVSGETVIEWTAPENTTVSADLSISAENIESELRGALSLNNSVFSNGNIALNPTHKTASLSVMARVNAGEVIKLSMVNLEESPVRVTVDFIVSEVLLGIIPDRVYNGEWEMYNDYKNTSLKGINTDKTKLVWGDKYGSSNVWEFYFDDDGTLGEISEETANSKWMRKEEGAATNQLGSIQFMSGGKNEYLSRGHYDNVTIWNSPVDSVVAVNMDIVMNNPKTNRQTHFELYKNDGLISEFYLIGTTDADISKTLTKYISVEKNDKIILKVYVTDKNGAEVEDSSKGNSYQMAYSITETPEIQLNSVPAFSLTETTATVAVEVYNPSGGAQNVLLMLAVYDENNTLISATGKTVEVTAGGIVPQTVTIENLNAYSKARLYVWDGYAKMKPYYDSIEPEVDINEE